MISHWNALSNWLTRNLSRAPQPQTKGCLCKTFSTCHGDIRAHPSPKYENIWRPAAKSRCLWDSPFWCRERWIPNWVFYECWSLRSKATRQCWQGDLIWLESGLDLHKRDASSWNTSRCILMKRRVSQFSLFSLAQSYCILGGKWKLFCMIDHYLPVNISKLGVPFRVERMLLEIDVLKVGVHIQPGRAEVVRSRYIWDDTFTPFADLIQSHPHVPVPHLKMIKNFFLHFRV